MQMKTDTSHLSARNYVAGLAAGGRHDFTSEEAQAALHVSADAAKLALNRLSKQAIIASPSRGFYVIVPPEYRSLGSLPADQFIPALMKRLGQPYYAGLLSAAQYHGAAHHRPQDFQVMVAKPRRPIVCGSVHVAFIVRKRLKDVPMINFNTPRGTIAVSTPEATAIDLVGYHEQAGGFDNVATALSELAEKIDPDKLLTAAQTAPMPWAQRLGYLLEHVDAAPKALALRPYVQKHTHQSVPLLPAAPQKTANRDDTWKLYINVDVEAEA
jgi:predicted transcriptional regulator of viral defense system